MALNRSQLTLLNFSSFPASSRACWHCRFSRCLWISLAFLEDFCPSMPRREFHSASTSLARSHTSSGPTLSLQLSKQLSSDLSSEPSPRSSAIRQIAVHKASDELRRTASLSLPC